MKRVPLHFRIALLILFVPACAERVKVEPAALETPAEPTTSQLKMLEEEQRQFLWEVEHHGNILSRIGFSALASALKTGDARALTKILATDFHGECLEQPRETAIRSDIVEVVRQSDAGHPPMKLNREQFLAKLREYQGFFSHAVRGCKIALMKLRPTQEKNLDAPWEGMAQLRLWGEKKAGQPAEMIVYLRYQTVRPTKEAMDQPGWLLSCAITQSQLGWSKRFLMREVGEERGLEPQRLHDNWTTNKTMPVTGGVFLCDYDRDGLLDVLITDMNGYFLYKGLPEGKFKNVTAEVGLPEFVGESSSRIIIGCWVDLDGDGWEDLLLGPYIFRNVEGKRFQNVTALSNLQIAPNSSGVAVADYDGDGRMDVYIFQTGTTKADSWLDGRAGTGATNRLWRNQGNWRFEDVTKASGTSGGERSTFTSLWLDANNDNRPDLYVPNEFGDGVLYINQGDGTFRPVSLSKAACDFGTMGATCGDINNDGHIDVYCGNMYSKAGSRVIGNLRPDSFPQNVMAKIRTFVKGSELHLNRGDLTFEQKGQALQVADAGWAYGPALVDLDNDGWLDIYATCGYISRSRTEPDG
jgi:hypothetical protein